MAVLFTFFGHTERWSWEWLKIFFSTGQSSRVMKRVTCFPHVCFNSFSKSELLQGAHSKIKCIAWGKNNNNNLIKNKENGHLVFYRIAGLDWIKIMRQTSMKKKLIFKKNHTNAWTNTVLTVLLSNSNFYNIRSNHL